MCGAKFRSISSTHLARHGLTVVEYEARFGPATSDATRRRFSEALKGKGRKDFSEWKDFPLGEVPDSVIADQTVYTRSYVSHVRRRLGIPAFVGLILNQEGMPLRSIYEARYDAWLHWQDTDHDHEVAVPGLPCIADFKVGPHYIEVAGMRGYDRYDKRHQEKVQLYEQAGVRVSWLTREIVNTLYQDCPVELRFRERRCPECQAATRDLVNGMCRPCARKAWGQENGTKATCKGCGDTFIQDAGSPGSKFCTHACYSKSLETIAWPSWEDLDQRLQETSAAAVARELGVKPNVLYQRLYRRRTAARGSVVAKTG